MTRTNCLFITIYRINLLKQMTKERMETFKIIGVRPLKGCNKQDQYLLLVDYQYYTL